MINYYIRPGGTFIKIDTDNQIVDLVLNMPTQQTISTIINNQPYYNNAIQESVNWQTTDQTMFETNKNIVSQFLNNR